jgi:hypothetical protein
MVSALNQRLVEASIALSDKELREKLEAQYNQAESQAIYRLRKQKIELVGYLKRNLKVDGFLLRGLDGVRA